jgi:NADH-quinone oxidoreductase subunit E
MKARGNFDAVQQVDPLLVLSEATRQHIDHWVSKFPLERKAFCTDPGIDGGTGTKPWLACPTQLIVAVADYLGLAIRVGL